MQCGFLLSSDIFVDLHWVRTASQGETEWAAFGEKA